MSIMKEVLYSKDNAEIFANENDITKHKVNNYYLTFKSYTKTNCLFLIADIIKLEKENNINLKSILENALIFCFNKEIKKPRAKKK